MAEAQAHADNGEPKGTGFNTEEVIHKTRDAVRDGLERQPYLVLGVALGVGYILAAGMPRPLVSYLVRYGARSGASAALRSLLGPVLGGE